MSLCHTNVIENDEEEEDSDDSSRSSGRASFLGKLSLSMSRKKSIDKKSVDGSESEGTELKDSAQKKKKKRAKKLVEIDSESEPTYDESATHDDDNDDNDNDDDEIEFDPSVMPRYAGQSPDEVALCLAAARNGYVFLGATPSRMSLAVRDSDNEWHREQ